MSGSLADWAAQVFGTSSNGLGPWQMSARAVVILVYGVLILRLFGRRIFGRWTPLDIILSVLIGSNLSRTLTGNAPLLASIVATTVLLALYWLLARLCLRWKWVSRLVKGREAVLVEDGKVDWDEMRRQGLGPRDLDEALHAEGCEAVGDVRIARLERNGDINIICR